MKYGNSHSYDHIIDFAWTKLGVKISYSTMLRVNNEAVSILHGTPEESYNMLYCYLYMLKKINHGTITSIKLDEKEKFNYTFIALGANIKGFSSHMENDKCGCNFSQEWIWW